MENKQRLNQTAGMLVRAKEEQECTANEFRIRADQISSDDEKMSQLIAEEARVNRELTEQKRKLQDEMERKIAEQMEINKKLRSALRTKRLDEIKKMEEKQPNFLDDFMKRMDDINNKGAEKIDKKFEETFGRSF